MMYYINLFLYQHVFFYRYVVDYSWQIGQILIILVWIYLIKYKKVSGQKTALIAFTLMGIAMICNICGWDMQAGLLAQYVLIFFFISFVQEFYHFLKHENK